MSGCDCKSGTKDQTPDEVSEYLVSEYKAGRLTKGEPVGVGIFLVPDPEAGPIRYKKVVIQNLTFHDTGLRGMACTAFKCFPYGMSIEIDGNSILVDDALGCDHSPCTYAP